MAFAIVIRDINTNKQIAVRQVSADAGSLLRRQVAERLADEHGSREDYYAVEHELSGGGELGGMIDKYALAS